MVTMAERIGIVENEVKNLKDSNEKDHAELKKLIHEFIDSADGKYAPKWITTVLGFLASIFGGITIYTISRAIVMNMLGG